MKIFNALKQVLTFKDHTTVAELSRLTGKKQLDVLEVLNKNSHLFKRDKKTGKILGFHDVESIQRAKAFDEGNTYKVNIINYGAASEIFTKSNKPELEQLKETYYCGGFGDSYAVKVILNTPENVLKVERLGLIEYNTVAVKPIERLWKE